MKSLSLFLLMLIVLSGCYIRRGPEIRICDRLDVENIIELLPKNTHDIQVMEEQAVVVIKNMLLQLEAVNQACKRTFYNTLRLYDAAKLKFVINLQILTNTALFDSRMLMRSAANAAVERMKRFEFDHLVKNKTLFDAFEEYAYAGTDQHSKKTKIKNFLRWKLETLKHAGAHLQVEHMQQLLNLQHDIASLESQFRGNIVHATRFVTLSLQEMQGVCQDFIASLKKSKDVYIVPCNYHAFFTILEQCEVAATRKKFFLEFGQRAYPQNLVVLKELLQKRNELAKLLGYENYADYECAMHMAYSVKDVENVLWKLVDTLHPIETKNFEALTSNLPASVTLTPEGMLQPWDEAFVKRWYRKNHFHLDDKELATYFPLKHVLKEIRLLLEEFFNLSIEEVKVHDMWSPDVFCWRVRLLHDSSIVGFIFLDLFDRPGKTESACQVVMVPAMQDDCDVLCSGAVTVSTNIQKKTADEILLEFHDIKSLLHELGHGLHALFGATEFVDVSGTNVMRDFLEVPSQLLELFMTSPKIVRRLSGHVSNGQKMPEEMVQKIIAAEKFSRASLTERQCLLALVSLYFGKIDEQQKSHALVKEIYTKVRRHIAYDPDYYFETSFAHLADYGAHYYSYIWSEIIAASMFERLVDQHGNLQYVGDELYQKVLRYGGSKNPHYLVESFLKKKVTVDTLLKMM